MDIKTFETLRNNKKAEGIKREIENYVHKNTNPSNYGYQNLNLSNVDLPSDYLKAVLTVFSAYLKKEDENVDFRKLSLSEDIIEILLRVNDKLKDLIDKIKSEYEKEDMMTFMLFEEIGDIDFEKNYMNQSMTSPKSIIKLSESILEINSGENILDLCSGYSNFIMDSYINNPKTRYTGVDINYKAYTVSEIRKYLLKAQWNIVLQDAFEVKYDEKFDKVFSNFPFNLPRVKLPDEGIEKISELTGIDEKTISISTTWHFILKIIQNLKPNGKGIGIMENGALFDTRSSKIRQWLVENGYIESIINLPQRMFHHTGIGTTLIVLSHGNDNINMINATEIGNKGRRITEFSKEDINQIINLQGKTTKISTIADKDAIKELNYDLTPLRYMEALTNIENGVRLEDLTLTIKRGLQIKASSLEEIKSEENTGCRYLTVSEIEDGYINYENNFIKEISKDKEKYLLKNNFMVMSRTSTPFFKSGIVEIPKDEKVIATGNMYILEFDEEKVNPQYVQAFFESDLGKMSIKSISGGSVLQILSLNQLRDLVIPVPERKIQDEIALEYMTTVDELKILKKKYEEKKETLSHIYEEGFYA